MVEIENSDTKEQEEEIMKQQRTTFSMNWLVAAALIAGASAGAQAATIAQYPFDSASPTAAPVDPNVTANDMATNIGANSGFSSTGTGNAYVRASATPDNQADAVTDGTYFYFTITPHTGYALNLSTFFMKIGEQTSTTDAISFTSNFFLRSSADGYASDIAITDTGGVTTYSGGVATRTTTINSSNTPDGVTFDLSGAIFQNITTTLTFRIYTFDTGEGTGTNPADSSQSLSRFDTVTVEGETAAVPEPATLALLAVGGLMWAGRRSMNRRAA